MLVRAIVQSSFDSRARQLQYVRLEALLSTVLDTRTSRPHDLNLVELSRTLPASETGQRYSQVYPKGSDPTFRRITRRSSRARDELLAWAKARDFREQATQYLNRARLEPEGDVQRRFVMSRSITGYSQRQKRVTLADWAMSDAGSRRLLKVEVPTGALKFKLSA